ncbi:homoserine dehydrogenase [Pullulanibacillus pueri]|uniref:Homoserine dehydrogenase n=1 Tax=Pullulanibacillus pueri TaxID=1437324 RepID=A0A8J2ZVJ4_9BACL|nr:homoserine dehydrogenase [Pullulanibacillus pueri]MBM7682345.1 homoserine dehydrogenase [Pullulanibacillus pueri]GGH80718.1 homoserine dehydrogenase [Pullulanibacillus pueri]
MKNQVNVGLLGFGTVGCGVYRILEKNQEELIQRTGYGIKIQKILVRDRDKKRDLQVDTELLTESVEDVTTNPEIDVVIEVMGGVEEAREYILSALNHHKHVVTANKDLLALYSGELLTTAANHDCDLYYEASVAGGIPIIRSLVGGLASDRITKMMGIVNGTTNYILTRMTKEGADYQEVLKDAQALGFAEADPSGDVEGLDAARKMVILSTLGFSMKFNLKDVQVQGISNISSEDIDYAGRLGYTIKLIGIAQKDEGRVEISVQPSLLPSDHPLSSVNNEFNAIYIYGESIGETMFYGPGAGQLPTATAVVSDLISVVQNMRMGVNGQSVVLPHNKTELKNDEDVYSKYFLRLYLKDEAGAFSKVSALFGNYHISIEKLIQQPLKEKGAAEIVMVTHQTNRAAFNQVLSELKGFDIVYDVISSYRIEGE